MINLTLKRAVAIAMLAGASVAANAAEQVLGQSSLTYRQLSTVPFWEIHQPVLMTSLAFTQPGTPAVLASALWIFR